MFFCPSGILPEADDSDIDDAMILGSTPTLGSTPKV